MIFIFFSISVCVIALVFVDTGALISQSVSSTVFLSPSFYRVSVSTINNFLLIYSATVAFSAYMNCQGVKVS